MLQQRITIAASPAELFALTQDYERRLLWDPFLKQADLLDGAREAQVGVRALCVSHAGWAMETEYVSFNPPHVCAIKMTLGPWCLRSFAGSWQFRAVEHGMTEVTFHYHLVGRPGLLTPLLKWIFARDTRRRLGGLKHAVEQRGGLCLRSG